ncbi:anoctamin-10 isoform X8 [Eurosta solidaginis]|uniref:anoctamin-10 isoform X8 n=1 Tax=Eurosta solidaginis TaxID=178769 RepID=UPI003530E928
MDKSFENLLQSGVGGDMSSERQSSDDVHESAAEDAGLDAGDDFTDENNFESNLRRRRGKIISCAKETIENASRQLRRKVPYAGHLMTPRRLWLNKIPTQCDVVIEFPEDAPDEALRWLLARLRSQPPSGLGLVVQVKAHESTRRNAFYISSPTNVLFKAAEEARLPKRLRPDLGGALREFTTRESHCFQQLKVEDGSNGLFTSQERQWLVLQVLQGLRASPTDIEALQGRAAVAEGQSIVAAWQETGLIVQVFPLHETRSLAMLQNSWVKQIFAPQPLDDIAEYFGVKVALYFAWLGHYTCALGVPAVFGTILYAALWGKGQTAQDMGHVLFSLFNVAWASLYLEAWKRYSVELAFRWGTLSTPPELLEPPRPLYKGTLVENNVTGRLEPKEAPAWKRRAFRYFVSFPIIGVCLAMVFVVMFLMLRFQDWWDSKLPEESILCCLSVIPKVLLAGVITLMDEAYYNLAVWLNDQENYRLQSKYENHLIAKVALFQFVNSFLSLFYIAFYLRDEDKLKEQLAGLLISRQIIGNLRESAIPYFIEQWKLAKLSFNMWGALSPTQNFNRTIMDVPTTTVTESDIKEKHNTNTPQHTRTRKESNNLAQESNLIKAKTSPSKRNIGQAEIESSLYKYDGTFSDHLEMLVQMGYVVLFSAAFPLAGICALINNLIEIRSDAFKLTHVHQRPFGQRVANIGTWQNAFSILSLAAVIVNCALIGLSGQVSRLWPGLTAAQTIILIVTLEHIMLGLRSALTWLLPELPSWLAAEIARAEHFRREMQCKGTSPRPTPPTPPSTTSTQPDQEALHLDIATTNDQSMESQVAEDILNQEQLRQATNYPQIDDIANYGLQRNIEADVNIFENRDSSPDSPQSQELQSNKEATDILKSAPSWGNIAIKTSIQHQTVGSSSSSSAGGGSAGSAAVTGTGRAIDSGRPSVGGFTTSTSSMHLKKISDNGKHIPSVDSSVSNVSIAHSGITEDEAKAAELAAKKSRLKQKLVKSARSVGIFSLKLKERRQREAEKAANIAIEHAKALAKLPPMPQPGGELSLIPIEQLIQIDDIKPTTKPQPNISSTTTTSATTSSATTTSPQIMTSSSSALAAAMQQFQSSGNH